MLRLWVVLALAFVAPGCLGIPIHARTKKKPLPADLAQKIPYEWVEVPVDEDTTLRGIWAPCGSGPPVLLLYGSGMGIRGSRQLIEMLHDGGYGVLCCDYRGTGYSSGRWWTSRFLDDDARALWTWLRREKGEPAGVVGVSIGAIAAAELVHIENPPAAVVLDRPVDPRTVIRRFVRTHLGRISAAISRLLVRPKCYVDLRERLATARTDVLVLLPEDDALCLPRDIDHMSAEKADSVTVAVAPGGHLSSHLARPRLWRGTLLDFLDARLRPGQPPLGGRDVTPDPAQIEHARLEGRDLRVELDRDDLPHVTLLLMGRKGNSLLRLQEPGRVIEYRLSCRHRRRLGKLLATRAVADDFRPTTGTRWITGEPPPEPKPPGDPGPWD